MATRSESNPSDRRGLHNVLWRVAPKETIIFRSTNRCQRMLQRLIENQGPSYGQQVYAKSSGQTCRRDRRQISSAAYIRTGMPRAIWGLASGTNHRIPEHQPKTANPYLLAKVWETNDARRDAKSHEQIAYLDLRKCTRRSANT